MRIDKQVVRYLKGTASLSLCYGRETEVTGHRTHKYGLIGYADSYYAGDPEVRKSVMGYCFFFNGELATWSSKRQITLSTSTTEAEYIALGHCLGIRLNIIISRRVSFFISHPPFKGAGQRIGVLGQPVNLLANGLGLVNRSTHWLSD